VTVLAQLSLTDGILDHPVRDRLPPGFNTAFKIVKEFIDPGLTCDAYADEPWLYGPSLSCWFAFRLGEKVQDGEDFPAPGEEDITREGADGSGKEERERLGLPENNEKRRKFFLDAKNRENFVFQKDRCYQADFFNPYLDFGNCALKLPGFSLNVIKYVDQKSHCLRYVFKNRESGNVYLNVNIALLWDDDLRKAIEADREGDAPLQASIGGVVEHTAKESSPRDSLQTKEEYTNHSFHTKEKETKVDSTLNSNEEEITKATSALDLDSSPITNNEEAERRLPSINANSHDSIVTGLADRPSFSGLPAVEHISDGKVPESGRPGSIDIIGARAEGVQDLLQATATKDKRGREVGIF
jgi:hypothetical protein